MTPTPSEVLTLSAAEIARRIRQRTLTPTDAVTAHIERIKQVNPYLNAVITPMFDTAQQAADDATAYINDNDTDDLPPLFGVPVTIKDSWGVEGVRFVGGSWYHRDAIAADNASPVQKFRDAGAIILGKTNCPDMCWLAETINPVFGRTLNARHADYTPGGSSGGEGAIIAAGGSPLGIGSDIAGSVRIPAAANGIVSIKPTGGRIHSDGHKPTPPDDVYTWNSAGPMARRVDDLALALEVLSRTPVRDYRTIDLADTRLTVFIDNGEYPVSDTTAQTVTHTAHILAEATGMQVVRDDSLPLLEAAYLYLALFKAYARDEVLKTLGGGSHYNLLTEALYNLTGQARISGRVLYFDQMMTMAGRIARVRKLDSFAQLDALRDRILDVMQPDGLLMTPLFIQGVPRQDWTWLQFRQPPYTFLFNALEFPAAVVPVGYDAQGLPYSVQIIGHPGDDERVLAAAAQVETLFGGWQIANPHLSR